MRKITLLGILVLLVAALSVPALAQEELPDFIVENRTECEVDLTGQEFTLWHLGDLSGPYAPITQPFLAGFADSIAYFNERGGACGATLNVPDPTTVDTGGDQEQTQIIYDRVSGEDPVAVILYSSDDSELLREQLAEDEIPAIISAGSIPGLYGADADSPGWVFATNPLYVDQFGHFCEYAAENIESPVVGYLSWPSAFGRAAFTPEAVAYCESLGVDIVDEPEYFAPGSDISGQIQNLVDNGANILYTNSLASGPAEIAATLANLGLRDQVTLAGVNWVMDTSVAFLGLGAIGPDGLPAVNGIIGSMPFYWWTETDNPGIALMVEMADANDRDAITRNIAYSTGVLAVDIFIEGLIRTANRTGGEVNGAEMKATLENMEYSSLDALEVDFTGGLRDADLNRMSRLTYLGQDGGPVGPDNPPVLVDGPGGQQIPVPIVVPLEDFRDTPDVRPGGASVEGMDMGDE